MNVLARIAIAAVVVAAAGIGLYLVVGETAIGKTVGEPAESLDGLPKDDDRLLFPDVKPAAQGPYPKIQVDEMKHDFGAVALGRSVSHVFTIKNVGDAPLELGEPITTCKCTAPKAGNGEPIPPGGMTTVELTYTPENAANEFLQRAFIHTNDPTDKRLQLEVFGSVEDLLKMFPGTTVDFGAVDGKSVETRTFKVLSRLLEKVTVVGTDSSSDYLEATVEPADLSEPVLPPQEGDGDRETPSAADRGFKSGIEVTVKLLPDMAVGRFRESIVIRFDEEPPEAGRVEAGKMTVDYSKMKAEVVGTVQGPFNFVAVQRNDQKFLPNALALNLGTFSAEQGTKGTLQLFVSGMDKPLELSEIDSSEDYVKLQVRRDETFPADSGRQKLFLDFIVPPGEPPATHVRTGKVTVTAKTNHPDARQLQFYIEMTSFKD